jgi:hypothetical protein
VMYACESRADVVVWLAAGSRPFRPDPIRYEHRRALERLNEVFAGYINFFGVELWVESDPRLITEPELPLLPRLTIVVRPKRIVRPLREQ